MTRDHSVVLYNNKIKNVAVVFRDETEKAETAAKGVSQWLSNRGVKVFSHPGQVLSGTQELVFPEALDLVVVLGGDGTYLKASRMMKGCQVPFLGFNMGSLGFLTIAREEELWPMLELALAGQLEVRHRSMIQIHKTGKDGERETFLALNDLVVQRATLGRLINITVAIDALPITCLKADGIIVATPTGSSAYNMAAGGPLMHPETRALVVTALSSHSLASRPLVLPDDRPVSFSTSEVSALTVDGVQCGTFSETDQVFVERARSDHLFLLKAGIHHFSVIKEKLKFGVSA